MTQNEDPNALVDLPVPQRYYQHMVAYLASLYNEAPSKDAAEQPKPEPVTPKVDEAMAERMYLDSEPRHRRLLEALASEAGQWVFTAELAKELGVTSGSKGMAGIFGAFGRRAKHRYQGAKPWSSEWDPVHSEARYQMTPEVAAWIIAAARGEGE